jgi:murein L,D-transpeptidase YcbB/YkuD
MKMRHIAVAASAALLSYGAIAGGGQQQSQSGETTRPQASADAETVRQAQDQLRAAGYPATPQGLMEFQQAKGLEAHGKLDQQTLAALGVDSSASSSAATGASSGRDAQPSDTSKY